MLQKGLKSMRQDLIRAAAVRISLRRCGSAAFSYDISRNLGSRTSCASPSEPRINAAD